MSVRKLACGVPLALVALLTASCGEGADTGGARSTLSIFAPSSAAEIADASSVRVQGIVRSEPRTYEISQEPAPPGADGPPRPQVFSYEVVDVEVEKVLGPKSDQVRAGQVIPVGVAVVTITAEEVLVTDREQLIPPAATFTEDVGAHGVFFLNGPRTLGTYGEGYELVGYAKLSRENTDRAIIKGVPGNLRGTSVSRQDVNNAAARSKQ